MDAIKLMFIKEGYADTSHAVTKEELWECTNSVSSANRETS
jgi:hypothetical protein